jgi:uncharacterized membrane protein
MASLSPWMEKMIDKTIQMLQNDVLKKKIQILILQPFLQYIIELIFPYVIIICAIFGLMILMMVSILGLLVFRLQAPAVAVVAAAGSSVV